jgi:hypothetical protein
MKQLQQYESQAHQHLRRGDDQAALSCFERAFDVALTLYCASAQALVNQGDWEVTLLYLKDSIDLSSDAVSKDFRYLGQLLNKIGFLRHCLRDVKGAAHAHQLALLIHAELLSGGDSTTDVVSCDLDSRCSSYPASS